MRDNVAISVVRFENLKVLTDDAIQPVYALMFRVLRLYRGMLVFTSLSDLMRISKAVTDSDRGGLCAQPDNDPYALA
jgi:hypothetical protein